MDKLTLEHLAPYLPYRVKMQVMREDGSNDIITLNASKVILIVDGYYCGTEKMFLRPLSDLTKEIEHNGERFGPLKKLKEIYPNSPNWDNFSSFWIETSIELSDTIIEHCIMNQLIKWRFDVFGLIEKGLAISTDTLGKEVEGANN